ncbi:MAG: heme biosynthesis protein HemY [Betaproteobacteria bacterium]|nr:heme biosynthesis protein HemY [Betaproteobacteria bacterium]
MRGLVWFLVVAALAVGLALVARMNEGYVLVVVPPWRVEVSLALALMILVATFALLYSLLRIARHTLRLPSYVAAFRRRQRSTRAHEALRAAWQAYLEGRYGRAHKMAARAFELDEAPGIAALIAARSSHFMRDTAQRDAWLARAEGVVDESRYARLSTQAELLLDERRFEEARAILVDLHNAGPRHVSTLRMLMRAEQGLQNWEEVLRLIRQLERRGALSAESARQLTLTATVENLRLKSLDADGIRHFWRGVDDEEKFEPRVALTAARLFMRLGDYRTAHTILANAIEHQWNHELVLAFGEAFDVDAFERLELAERWLATHPPDAALLLTLGRLCVYRELWGKAQSYFEASLSQDESKMAHVELARLLERIGKQADAHQHYRAATNSALPE